MAAYLLPTLWNLAKLGGVEMPPTHLIVGLGNPGEEYVATRHNIGFRAVEALAEHYSCPLWKKKFKGLLTASETFLLL